MAVICGVRCGAGHVDLWDLAAKAVGALARCCRCCAVLGEAGLLREVLGSGWAPPGLGLGPLAPMNSSDASRSSSVSG
eukprot:4782749-Alexandrium_andersonii.AAC.1